MEIAVRIDEIKKQEQLNKWLTEQCIQYVYSHEIAKETKKSHYHYYLQIRTTKKLETLKKWIREQLKDLFGCSKSSFCVQNVEDKDKYICYIIKDGNYQHNLPIEDIERLEKLTKVINIEKTLKMKDKILAYCKSVLGEQSEEEINGKLQMKIKKTELCDTMMRYFEERSLLKPSPTSNLFIQYMIYLMDNFGFNTDVFYHQRISFLLQE